MSCLESAKTDFGKESTNIHFSTNILNSADIFGDFFHRNKMNKQISVQICMKPNLVLSHFVEGRGEEGVQKLELLRMA